MTPEAFEAAQKRARKAAPTSLNQNGSERFRALGRLPKGQMNKTEEAYAQHLEAQRLAGLIIGWKFHPLRVRLADNTYYEVDFLVMEADRSLTIVETKGGFTTDKGQIKIKLCAEVLPWFRMIKATKLPAKEGGGFREEEF
jgi:hypothetical protein